jgi:hypothetical protein
MFSWHDAISERRDRVTTAVATLEAADRCDRCGAQAYIRATLPGGSELLFCGHHGRHHEAKLRPLTAEWHDETDRLTETPATAPAYER